MKDTKLGEILGTFTEADLKLFGKFLNSGFVKSRRDLSSSFNLLKKFHPHYDFEGLSINKIFAKLFPGEKFSKKKISNLIYDMTKAAESFIAHTVLEEDELETLFFLGKGLYDRKLFGQALKKTSAIEKKFKPEFSLERELLLKRRRLESLKINIYSEAERIENAIESRNRHDESIIIQFLIDYVWLLSEQSHLQFNTFRQNENDLFRHVRESINLNKFMTALNNYGLMNKKIISLHFYIYKTIEEPDNPENYYPLKKLFLENLDHFGHYEKFIILFNLIKFSLNIYNKNIRDMKKQILEDYMLSLDLNAYSPNENEFLEATYFRNILHFAASAPKPIENIETFIKKNISKLNPDEAGSIKLYSEAYLNFHKKDFGKALELLSKIEDINKVFVMDIRMLKLKIFYELNYIDESISAVDALKHYISKNKDLNDQLKEQVKMFLKTYTKLVNKKASPQKKGIHDIINEFDNLKFLYNRNWLKEKIMEME